MKKKIFVFSACLAALIFLGYFSIYIWIDFAVKKNIKTAKDRYSGNAETALIDFLMDSTNSYRERSHLAIWTLGQIGSEKSIPVLQTLYKNDPEGKTCYGKHDTVLCQYEIYKALNASKVNWWPLHRRLNK